MRLIAPWVVFVAILQACLPGHAAMQRTYFVGNSLTWDANPPTVKWMADAGGHTSEIGYHIRCGSTLNAILANPTETCVAPTAHGTFGTALPGYTWDSVTIQPYPGAGSTLLSDTNSINDFMSRTSPLTTPYIYAAWPTRPLTGETFAQAWLQPVSGSDDQATITSRDYFNLLLDRIQATRSASHPPVRMVPAGEVLYEVERAIMAGDLAGFSTIADLYRDAHHLNNVGRFIAGTTFYATLYAENPTGQPLPGTSYAPNVSAWPNDRTITPELRDQLQTLVWDVVSTHPQTGVPEPTVLPALALAALALRRRR